MSRVLPGAGLLVVGALVVSLVPPDPPANAAPRAGFRDAVVLRGLTAPTAVRFSPDGRVFVAEKSGLVKVFSSLSDPTASVFADLRTRVFNGWDRGLLGLALDPRFPARPYVYVSYTFDAAIGGAAPRWGHPGATSDDCPDPPGAGTLGCVVSGRVSRLTAAGNHATAERVLVEDWCQQFQSHSMGDLRFDRHGALLASGGDGASFTYADYGQTGNPCADPPGGAGTDLTPPTARGGALRAQSARRPAGNPVSLGGSVVRISPASGAGLPANPFAASANPNKRRIVAYGLRNPFRTTVRPGTDELWIGDVGWARKEEIDRLVSPTARTARNFGWPCYEGPARQSAYSSAGLTACTSLYKAGSATGPFASYTHDTAVVRGEACNAGSSSLSGLAFYDRAHKGGNYPKSYTGSLFFADYSRSCIWVMRRGANGLPSPAKKAVFISHAANPVDLEIGPRGDLFYVDLAGGTVHRVRYSAGDRAPTARIRATPRSGKAPLKVTFDGRGSSDPDRGDTLRYAWDLNGDGRFDDGTKAVLTHTYRTRGTRTVRLRVTDRAGASGVATTTIRVADTPPVPTITTPTATTTWRVGDVIRFSGRALDAQDGLLPASRLSWTLVMRHCPSSCHSHVLRTYAGVASGSFAAPDHEYPAHLELRLTAKDSTGSAATTRVSLQPRTATLRFVSNPAGLALTTGYGQRTAPFTVTVIAGSANSVGAPSPQTGSGTRYVFRSWSDGGARTHQVTAPGSGTVTYTATFGP